MRIFCAVRHAKDPRHFYGGLWSGNFYRALRQLGHEVVESQVDLAPSSRFMHIPSQFTVQELEVRERTTEKVLDEVRAAQRLGPLHLFLSYFYNSHFDPAGFDELRRLGVPSVNFYCNSIYQLDLVAGIAARADFAWHAERDAHAAYLALGAKPIWVQMAADPDVYHPVGGTARAPRACFVGQRYADRDRWMGELVRAAVPVSIFGPGWSPVSPASSPESGSRPPVEYLGRRTYRAGSLSSYAVALRRTISDEGLVAGGSRLLRQALHRQGTFRLSPLFVPFAKGAIPFEEIKKVFSAHEVCLNFSNVWADGRPGSALVPHVRLRDFEAPMCRACYLTGYTEEIEEFYRVKEEVDTYSTPEELVDKTRFYLAHPSAAERLREAGYRRALRDHTWKRRFVELFGKIGMQSAAHAP